MDQAVKVEKTRLTSDLAIASAKLEKFPYKKQAMELFDQGAAEAFGGDEDLELEAADVLCDEAKASSFVNLSAKLRFKWLFKQIKKNEE
ncbi:uncharacterized protein MELLADRAFT_70828 [Melampsora larici-populina 98AG31]|uniref:Uncharacterized protein n=1 Tax=Melampsora larici-populina (strain 98AG31 / pathotype 3-4-7) TaxID=747676 RepID=F4R8C7_MELLP|nr:uncharacterized protein MELLADRAFT_70828 [Melampsora larici-populina 98AG31]EGG11468.1 hypothetical protein MELLADRAFT_70828 [Melampsora larici-populina 98AG31]